MRKTILLAVCAVSFASITYAQQTQETTAEKAETQTAAGTCEEAKQQHTYWCEERESVSVISFGMECENAKRNMAEACGAAENTDSKNAD